MLLERGRDEKACMCGSECEMASCGILCIGLLGGNGREETGMAERCESIKKKFVCTTGKECVSKKEVKVKSMNGTSLK